MVERVEATDGLVEVELLLDDPTCLYLADIFQDIQNEIYKVDGVERVDIKLKSGEIWTEERADREVQQELANRRAGGRSYLPVMNRGVE